MGLEKMIKREIGITIATVLLVTTVFLMFSYAIFKVDVSGDTNVITFGDVSMSFCTNSTCNSTIPNIGNIIGTTKAEDGTTKYVPIYPAEKSEAEVWVADDYAKLTPYIFTLTNDGTLSLDVTLFLNRDTTPGLSYTVDDVIYKDPVEDDQIMIAIGEQGTLPTKMLYSNTTDDATGGKVIAKFELKPSETKIMNLYAWLKSDAENAAQGKYFVSKISARGEFIPE